MSKSKPYIVKGEVFIDNIGDFFSCNNFDVSKIKRMYIIDNSYVIG